MFMMFAVNILLLPLRWWYINCFSINSHPWSHLSIYLLISIISFYLLRWSHSIHHIELLALAVNHLSFLTENSWRPAIAYVLYCKYVLPVFKSFLLLEEDAFITSNISSNSSSGSSSNSGGDDSSGGSKKVGRNSNSSGKDDGNILTNLQAAAAQTTSSSSSSSSSSPSSVYPPKNLIQTPDNISTSTSANSSTVYNLIMFMKEPRLLKSFVNSSAEILGFLEVVFRELEKENMVYIRALNKYIENNNHG